MNNSKTKCYIVILMVMLVALSGCGNQVATETTEQTTEFSGINDWTGESETMGSTTEEQYDMTPTAIVGVRVGDNFFTIDLEDNSSAKEFFDKINSKPLTVEMQDYGGFEKVGDLPWELPMNDEQITTQPGGIILYQGNKITVYYGENTWKLTKLGSISGHTPEDVEAIKDAFGGAEYVTAEFFVEWTE